MTPINRCRDCGKTLSTKAKRCTCGRIIVEENLISINEYRCQFVEFGKRCEREGTICNSVRGKEWYCCKHWYPGSRNKL